MHSPFNRRVQESNYMTNYPKYEQQSPAISSKPHTSEKLDKLNLKATKSSPHELNLNVEKIDE